jgi:hypothetical protein
MLMQLILRWCRGQNPYRALSVPVRSGGTKRQDSSGRWD